MVDAMSGDGSRQSIEATTNNQQEVAAVTGEFGVFTLPVATGPSASGMGMLTANKSTPVEMVAIRRKWNIPPSVFEKLADRMEQIANSESRQAVAAAKVLLDMNEQNERDEQAAAGGGDVMIFLPDNGRGQ